MPDVIRQRRQSLGMSQAELASRANVDVRQIRRYEAGESQPTLPAARAIADALSISIDVLAGALPLEGLGGIWWIAMVGSDRRDPLITQVEVNRTDGDYEAAPFDPHDTAGLPPGWRMTLRRARDLGLMVWFTHQKAAGVALLEPMSPGWAGRWLSVPVDDSQRSGLLALSRVSENLPDLLRAVTNDNPR